jgi:WD40 repeat protein
MDKPHMTTKPHVALCLLAAAAGCSGAVIVGDDLGRPDAGSVSSPAPVMPVYGSGGAGGGGGGGAGAGGGTGFLPSSGPPAGGVVLEPPAGSEPAAPIAIDGSTASASAFCAAPGTFAAPPGHTFSIAYSPDGTMFATGGESSPPNAHLFRTSDGALIRSLAGHVQSTYSVAFSPDGTLLATAGNQCDHSCSSADTIVPGVVKLWRVSDGALLADVRAQTGYYGSAAEFSHDGRLLATSGSFGNVEIWRVSDGARLTSIVYGTTVYTVRFSPDDTLIVTASTDGTAHVFRVSDGSPVFTLLGHSYSVSDAVFSPDGTQIATSGYDNRVVIFDIVRPRWVQTLEQDPPGTPGYLQHVIWPRADLLVTNDWSGNVQLWTRGDHFVQLCRRTTPGQSLGLAMSPDGTELKASGATPAGPDSVDGVWTWRP